MGFKEMVSHLTVWIQRRPIWQPKRAKSSKRLLLNRFEFTEPIDGPVYLGYDHEQKIDVAIKTINLRNISTPDRRKRFEAEAEILKRLKHKNIVEIIEHEEDYSGEGKAYIVMPYYEKTLRSFLEDQESRCFDIRQAIVILKQICQGVNAAHREGIIHCDLKPGNILVDDDGRILVTDFGIAHDPSNKITRTSWEGGTLDYMAPEQFRTVRDKPSVDIYAIGVIAFWLVTGEHYLNFGKQDSSLSLDQLNQRREKIQNETPYFDLLERETAYFEEFVAFVEKALQKEPVDRFTNTTEMLIALRRLEKLFEPDRNAPPDDSAPSPPGASTIQSVIIPSRRKQIILNVFAIVFITICAWFLLVLLAQ